MFQPPNQIISDTLYKGVCSIPSFEMFGVGFSFFNHRNQISPNSLHKAAICRSPRVSLGCAVQGFPWAAESYSIRKSHLVANVILGRAIALSPSSHFHGMWMYDRFHGGYGR